MDITSIKTWLLSLWYKMEEVLVNIFTSDNRRHKGDFPEVKEF